MSGSFTVADSPTRRRPGANRCSRASARFSRSPRLSPCTAWISSRITTDRPLKNSREPGHAQKRASCSGVVSRMSGGCSRWRVRLARLVSPVRASTLMDRPISAIGASRLRCTSTASAFSGERYRVCTPRGSGERGAGRQLDQARQEARQRLAAAGRRDQQGVAPAARLGDHLQLVRADAPAAAGEPVAEAFGQQVLDRPEGRSPEGRSGVHLSHITRSRSVSARARLDVGP